MKNNDKGVTAVEYGLISALLSIVIISSVALTGVNTKDVFCEVGLSLQGSSGEKCSSGNIVVAFNDGGSISELENSLSDTLDTGYIDSSEGGTADDCNCYFPTSNHRTANVTSLINKVNSADPIVNIMGLYYRMNGTTPTFTPITTYDDLTSSSGGNYATSNYAKANETTFEVTTQSGKAYILDPNAGTITENSAKVD